MPSLLSRLVEAVMFHPWPLAPIPEAQKAINEMKMLIWDVPPRP
jgi:hypothetical protein